MPNVRIVAATFLSAFAMATAASAGGAPRAACAFGAGDVLELRGTVRSGGLAGAFTRRVEAGTGRFSESTDLGVIATARGYDGRLAWLRDVSGASHDLDSDFARALAVSEAWLNAWQACPAGAIHGAMRLGDKIEAERTFQAWRITPAAGAPIELWYDDAGRRLDRAILQAPESRLIRHFADWRDVGAGRFVAFLQRDEDPEDEDEIDFAVTQARWRATGRADDFRRPPQPHDARLLGGRGLTTVPYEDDHRTRIYVPVYLNGAGPYLFELDNGGHFILDVETAKSVGLTPKGSFSQTGAGQAIAQAGYARLREVRIGDAVMSDQPAKVRSMSVQSNERGPKAPRAGILGLEFFERFVVSIDRRQKTVTLRLRGTPYPTPPGHKRRLVFAEDAPLIAGAFEGHRGDFMLDTGNAGPTIIEDFWARPLGLASLLRAGLAQGDATVSRHDVTVGDLRMKGEAVSYYGPVARGSEYTRAVAGVLGEPLLSRLNATYDYGRKAVWLEALPEAEALALNRTGLSLAKTAGGDFSISAVLPGSPAAESGLTVGDHVEALAGTSANRLSRADAVALMRQPVGTTIEVEVERPGAPTQAVRIRLRDLIPPPAAGPG